MPEICDRPRNVLESDRWPGGMDMSGRFTNVSVGIELIAVLCNIGSIFQESTD